MGKKIKNIKEHHSYNQNITSSFCNHRYQEAGENSEEENQMGKFESNNNSHTKNFNITSDSSKTQIQIKNFLSNMKHDISRLNTLLHKKRRHNEIMEKEKRSSDKQNDHFYSDYNNFLIKFFRFNSEKNTDSVINGIKTLSFGFGQDLELNECKNKQLKNTNNPELKIIGIVKI